MESYFRPAMAERLERWMMTEAAPRSLTEGILDLLRKVEVRLEKARNGASGLGWYKRINPARGKRLKHYDAQLSRARESWREGDSTSTLALLQAIDQRYPSLLGLVYGTPRKRENRKEVHEIEEESSLKRLDMWWRLAFFSLFQQTDAADDHFFVHGLAHVVDRQGCYAHSR